VRKLSGRRSSKPSAKQTARYVPAAVVSASNEPDLQDGGKKAPVNEFKSIRERSPLYNPIEEPKFKTFLKKRTAETQIPIRMSQSTANLKKSSLSRDPSNHSRGSKGYLRPTILSQTR